MARVNRKLSRRRGAYGIDAPYVPVLLLAGGIALGILAVINALGAGEPLAVALLCLWSGTLLASAASYLIATRWGKFAVWAEVLSGLDLKGDEQVLDMGCGRGAVLLMAAALLTTGKATGIDLWRRSDQSGNDIEITRRNAEKEGVADRVELYTGDMTSMPFPDASFDVVLSSLAIHNVRGADGRRQAVEEAVRVLRPGGRLAIADIRATREYEAWLRALGCEQVDHRNLGWRTWFGGPWVAMALVTAVKP